MFKLNYTVQYSNTHSSRLIAQDRHEEAKAFFATYHANGDADHPLVTLQMAEALEALHGEPPATWKDLFDLRVLFESRASRYRIMLNMTFSWFGQFSGNKYLLPILYYILVYYCIEQRN